MLNKLKNIKENITSSIKTIFNKDGLDDLARKTGFVKRSTSKLKGSELIEVLTVHMADDSEMSYEAMCDAISEINPSASLTPQSLEERINKPETVTYVKTLLEEAVNEKLSVMKSYASEVFNMFSEVDVRDSTTISLNQKLADQFKGSGGCASASAVKADAVYDLKNLRLKKLLSMRDAGRISPYRKTGLIHRRPAHYNSLI